MTVRQAFWISLEVICISLYLLIAWAVGIVDERYSWIVSVVVGTITAFVIGPILNGLGYIAKFMIIVNISVYFLILLGIFTLLISAVVAATGLNETFSWITGFVLSAIISFYLSRRSARKNNKAIEEAVNQHIDDI